MSNNSEIIRAAREAAGLSAREAARLVDVTLITWQRWEGQTSRDTEIPSAYLELFLLKTGKHQTHMMIERVVNSEPNFELFAEIVRIAEREECAKLCDKLDNDAAHLHPNDCSEAIRKRNNADLTWRGDEI